MNLIGPENQVLDETNAVPLCESRKRGGPSGPGTGRLTTVLREPIRFLSLTFKYFPLELTRDSSRYDLFLATKSTVDSPAGGGVDAGVRPGPPVDDGVAAVDDAALVRDAERPQTVKVVAQPRVVRLLGQGAHPRTDVVRHWRKEKEKLVMERKVD